MKIKPILIICGEPNSVFSEIIAKSISKYNAKRPIILIGSYKLLLSQLNKLKIKILFNLISLKKNKILNIKLKKINILNVDYKFKKPFDKISNKSNYYISECFKKSFQIINNNNIAGLINGPISKKTFLKSKFQGVTEFLSNKFNSHNNFAMLIFNKKLSVSPITTHLPVSKITKNLNKKNIILKILLINNFFKKYFGKKPKIAVCGLNPHCENFFSKSEELKIINPAIKTLKKKKLNIEGPYPADTIFMKNNIKRYDVIIGMYHDQVLAPIKALYNFDAINITLGLPILRISPDHGPNFKMLGKNKSDPKSLTEAIKFLDKIK
tara:strand:+ start:3335 stop:4306 length:972 start_codon:yes stop_codon:yes gene_type:complete